MSCLAEATVREMPAIWSLPALHTIKNYLFRIFGQFGVSNRIELLFMTLSQAAPLPFSQGLLADPADAMTKPLCLMSEARGKRGDREAQLALARMFSMGRMATVTASCSRVVWGSPAV